MENVLVFGSTGMLGQEVSRFLASEGIRTFCTARNVEDFELSRDNLKILRFDVTKDSIWEILKQTEGGFGYFINCIGAIPQKALGDDRSVTSNMILLNSVFPHTLSQVAHVLGVKIIQIATDCVFSGSIGRYSESSIHDAEDVYGISKSVGEVHSNNFLNLRCSIIGKHDRSNAALYNWALSQKPGATVNGFANHLWNGISTTAFAKIVYGIIRGNSFFAGTQHVVPADFVSKYELLQLIYGKESRKDLTLSKFDNEKHIDRRLSTLYPDKNFGLWRDAGYRHPPSISDIVAEM